MNIVHRHRFLVLRVRLCATDIAVVNLYIFGSISQVGTQNKTKCVASAKARQEKNFIQHFSFLKRGFKCYLRSLGFLSDSTEPVDVLSGVARQHDTFSLNMVALLSSLV